MLGLLMNNEFAGMWNEASVSSNFVINIFHTLRRYFLQDTF